MFARLGKLLCVIVLLASAPAHAGVVWDCTYTTVPDEIHQNSRSGAVKFQIDGPVLSFQFPRPMDAQLRDALAEVLQYQVLRDDDVGLVAVNAQSRIANLCDLRSCTSQPLVGATTVTINKTNGELHIGSVMQNGVHDLQQGQCELIQPIP